MLFFYSAEHVDRKEYFILRAHVHLSSKQRYMYEKLFWLTAINNSFAQH